MATMRRMSGTLADLGPMDPGGMALPAPTDPGGLALPQPGPMDPGGMALPMPGGDQTPQLAAPQWQNPAFGAGYNPFAPRISTVNGQTFLNEHGNQRLLQPGQEVTDAQNYVTDHFNKFSPFGGNVWGSGTANDPYANPAIGFPAGRGPAFGEGPPGSGMMPPGFEKMGGPPGIDWNSHLNPDGSPRTYQPGPWQTFSSGPHMVNGRIDQNALRGAIDAAGGLNPFISGQLAAGGWRGGSPVANAARALTFWGTGRGNPNAAQGFANRLQGSGGTLGNLAPTGSSYGVEQDPTLLR